MDINLSNRLRLICELADKGELIVDVGTDHAYVPIALVKGGAYRYAKACDVNKNVIEITKRNVAENGLEQRITVCLSDGLTNINDLADCVVIAGMGAELIADILEKAENKLHLFSGFVLQPQGKVELLRRALNRLSLFVEDERLVYEKGHYYHIIKAGRDDVAYKKMLDIYDIDTYLDYGVLPLRSSKLFFDYIDSRIIRYEEILLSLNTARNIDKEKLLEVKQHLFKCRSFKKGI